MKVLVLLVGIALAHAATTIVKNHDREKSITIHRNTPETYPSEFELGKTHRYNYTGDIRTSFPQTGNETIGQRIQCIIELVPLTTNIWNMKLVNPTVYEINGTHDKFETVRNSTTVTEDIRTLLMWNVTFQINKGLIKVVYTNETEPEWIVNLKKGMLNMINLDLHKDNFYVTDEEGVTGTCKTLYTITETINDDLVTILNVTKVKDLTKCSKTAFNKVGTFNYKKCDTCDNDNTMDAIATFKYNITGTKQRYIINSVKSEAAYALFPLGVKGGSMLVQVNQTLQLINITEDPLFKPTGLKPRGCLMYKFPEIVKVEETMLTTVNKVNFYLEKLDEFSTKPFTVDAPGYFVQLIKTLTEANYDTLEEIWKFITDKPQQRKWLIEAIPYVNEECMTKLIKELLTTEETLLTTEEKQTLLMRLGTVRQPTEKTVHMIKEICEHPFYQWPHNKKVNTTYIQTIVMLRRTCWRSLGIQIGALKTVNKFVSPTLVLSLTNCEKTFDKETMITQWDKTVYKTKENYFYNDDYLTWTDAKALLNTTTMTTVREMCLVAMGQTGLPDFITVIQPILEEKYTNQTLDVKIAAVTALRKVRHMPHKILSLLLPILRNPYEDSELRIVAYLTIEQTTKCATVLSLIGQELRTEKSKQVHSFIYSHMKMMAWEVEPCTKQRSVAARYALTFTKPFDLGPTYSKVRSVRTFDQESKFGAKVTTETHFSEGELVPRKTMLKVDVELLGKKTNLVKVTLKTSGITDLLEKMFGYNGHYYKRKNIFDLLKETTRKVRSVNTNEMELTKINKKVSPYEVKSLEPKASLVIMLFGNRVTDLDISKDYLYTLMKEGKFMTDFTNLDEELAKKQTINTTKGMLLVDFQTEFPTIMGIPISFNTTIASIVRVVVNTTFKAFPSLTLTQKNLTASVNITPEVLVTAVFKMGVHTPLIKCGSAINVTFNFTLPVKTNITIDFTKKKYELVLPQITTNQTFVNFTTKLYTFWQQKHEAENHTVVNTTLTTRKPTTTNVCIEPINDLKLCLNFTYVPRTGQPTSPFQPLTGCTDVSIYTLKTPMTPENITLKYTVLSPDWDTRKEIEVVMVTTGNTTDKTVKYENKTTMTLVIDSQRVDVTVRKTHEPQWITEIVARNTDGEIDIQTMWGKRKYYPHNVHIVNNTRKEVDREFFVQVNSPWFTWNDTRNITVYWGKVPDWLYNVTTLTKTYVLPMLLEIVKKTTDVEYYYEPLLNHVVNSTTISLKVKTNYTIDVEVFLPLEKITTVNVTTPFNTTVLNNTLPKTLELITDQMKQQYLSGNCTYNTTGTFWTYDKLRYDYNLTGSCPHVLTKDCSPNKRFTVLVQNTVQPNGRVKTVPTVTIYIDNNKIEIGTRNRHEQVYAKYNDNRLDLETIHKVETDIGTVEHNTTHITVKATIGLTVVYSKYNVTTYLSPWYVNKTCGLCGDFNGETFWEMKNPLREELTNSTKFGSSWLVHGDDCKDSACKLTKEVLYPLPETVYLANKPAVCFSKEPVMVCPKKCNDDTPENIFTRDHVLAKNYVKVPFFCVASENTKETKRSMTTRPDLIKSQPVDLYRDMEVPHGCICVNNCHL